MVFLSIFLLAGLDQTINPKSKQTIGKRVRFGLSDDEINRLVTPIDFTNKTGLSVRKRKRKGDVTF